MADMHPWWQQYIRTGAIKRGLDPAAVLAVASMEGLSGGVGDGGHAFGPFQLNDAGGVLTNRPGNHRQFAESRQGIDYALNSIAGVAKGLKGDAAINAIVTHFERPANPQKDIAGAAAHLGEFVGQNSTSASGALSPDVLGLKPDGTAPNIDPRAQIRASALSSLRDIAGGADAVQSFGNVAQLIRTLHQATPQVETPPSLTTGAPTAGDPSLDTKAIALAKKYLGVKYTWGGTNAGTGFDCSGLLQTVWGSLGVKIPRTTYDQWDAGKAVGENALKPGDAVFFTGADPMNGKPGHVGLYIGGGKFIEAPGTGMKVRISTLAGRSDYMGARRFG